MTNELTNNTKNLQREVLNKDGFICLKTEAFENLKYAYYLRHSEGTEKIFYTDNTECKFKIPFVAGNYTATFFYQRDKERKSFRVDFTIFKEGVITKRKKHLLGEGAGWRIDHYNNDSDVTFISFNGAGSSLNSTPFGLKYLLTRGFNVIACLQDDNQYQSLSFSDFKECVSSAVAGKDIFLYGSSLGGYCAVYYAGAVNGTVIAAAPRNSAHPVMIDKSNGKSPFIKEEFLHSNISDNPTTDKKIYILFDPYVKNDVLFIDTFVRPSYISMNEVQCEHAGHEVLFHVNKTKQLDKIIVSIVEGRDDVTIDVNIDSCYTHIGKARYHLNKKEYEKAVYFSNEALKDETVSAKLRAKFIKVQAQAIKMHNTK